MILDKTVEILDFISDLSQEDTERYSYLAELNAYPYADSDYDDVDQSLLAFYVAAKTYYQICLIKEGGEISSFTAGDVKITSSRNANTQRARALMNNAYENAAHLIEDKGFCFMEV